MLLTQNKTLEWHKQVKPGTGNFTLRQLEFWTLCSKGNDNDWVILTALSKYISEPITTDSESTGYFRIWPFGGGEQISEVKWGGPTMKYRILLPRVIGWAGGTNTYKNIRQIATCFQNNSFPRSLRQEIGPITSSGSEQDQTDHSHLPDPQWRTSVQY